MKTLKITSLLMFLLVQVVFTSCKKDKNEPGSNSGYEFAGTRYNITAALHKQIDDDIFLEFSSDDPGNYLQIVFANAGTNLPEGTITYNGDRFSGSYDPQKNFWNVSFGLEGNNINGNGGTVIITRSGDGYKINFNISTANGPITGEYNGNPGKI